MTYRTIPRSNIDVSVIALGCWAFAGGGNWGEQDDRDSEATVKRSLERGVTPFDTAVGYGNGHSGQVLGRALGARRSDAVIATKSLPNEATADELERSCDESLKRLGTDYTDLYQQQWRKRDVPIGDTVGGMVRLKEKGRIRAWGVCNYGAKDLDWLLATGTPATDQVCYSLLWRAIEYAVQPKCAAADIGIFCYSPIAQGLLTGKFSSADDVPVGRARTKHFSQNRPEVRHREPGAEQETFDTVNAARSLCSDHGIPMAHLAIRWLLEQRSVTSVLTGARTPDQVDDNAAAAEADLSKTLVGALTDATAALRERLGRDPDPWDYRMQ